MALSEQNIREKHSQNYANWNRPHPKQIYNYRLFERHPCRFRKYKEGSDSCWTFDGKRIMGKASFAELKDTEGRIQIYVSRDDISDDEEK
jgi:lysyl-tRNA synthetase class 2